METLWENAWHLACRCYFEFEYTNRSREDLKNLEKAWGYAVWFPGLTVIDNWSLARTIVTCSILHRRRFTLSNDTMNWDAVGAIGEIVGAVA
ncbi:MAG: hypothetical protein R3330_08930, partial [Saprospiraceae bacterium]|nr:hypothetical protein [Saprospiraceae bacterium]